MSKVTDFLALLADMTRKNELVWERNAAKTGFLVSLGEITAEVSFTKDQVGRLYTLQVRNESGTELARTSERTASGIAGLVSGNVKALYDTISESMSDATWAKIMEAAAKFRTPSGST